MVDATYIDFDRIQVVRNDDIVFDTERPSIALLEDAKITITNFDLVFPSFVQARAYYRNSSLSGSECENWSTLIWQEWGPDETYNNELWYPVTGITVSPGPTSRNLPRQLVGSVPSSANYLDIRARLTQYVSAPLYFGLEPPAQFYPDDEWFSLSGGSCITERIGPMARHFDVVRIGNNIYVERFQSVMNSGTPIQTSGPGGYSQNNLSSNQSGWNSYNQIYYPTGASSDGLDSNTLFPKSNSQLATLISKSGPANDGQNRRPGGTSPCVGPYPDWTSRYWLDLIITPGVYKPAS